MVYGHVQPEDFGPPSELPVDYPRAVLHASMGNWNKLASANVGAATQRLSSLLVIGFLDLHTFPYS